MLPLTPRGAVDATTASSSSAAVFHTSPQCSPIRSVAGDQNHVRSRAQRKLQFVTQAVPSGANAFLSAPSSVLAARDASQSRARIDAAISQDAQGSGSCFRRLLTSSQPDIHTLHSILVFLHRSEASATELHHASQAIGLLASLASDREGNPDCADMATAILSTLSTYPQIRKQLPTHAKKQLAEALIEVIGYNTTLHPGADSILPGKLAPRQSPGTKNKLKLTSFTKHSIYAASKSLYGLPSRTGLQNIPSFPGARASRSLSPGTRVTAEASRSAKRSSSLPASSTRSTVGAISTAHALLSSPSSPGRQLKSFAQRAMEKLHSVRQRSQSPPAILDDGPFATARVAAAAAAAREAAACTNSAAATTTTPNSVNSDSIPVPSFADLQTKALQQLYKAKEEAQEEVPAVKDGDAGSAINGVSGDAASPADRRMSPRTAAFFLQAAVQRQKLKMMAEAAQQRADAAAATAAAVAASTARKPSIHTDIAKAYLVSRSATSKSSDSESSRVASGALGAMNGCQATSTPPDGATTATSPAHDVWPTALQDTDTEPAVTKALSLVLSKCGLASVGVLKERRSSGGMVCADLGSEHAERGVRCSPGEEVPLRRAGRWVLASLSAASAAASDEVMLETFNKKRFTAMVSGWLDQGDNIQSTTAVLVSLALLEAYPPAASPPAPPADPATGAPLTPPRATPQHPFLSPPFLDALGSRCASLITRHTSPFARTLAMRAVAASGVAATGTIRVSDGIDAEIGLHMHDYIVMGLAHLGVTGPVTPCVHSMLGPLAPSYHSSGSTVSVAAAAAAAVASLAKTSDDHLMKFVEAGVLPGLNRGLASGTREEAAACAAALAVIARHPSAHTHLLRTGCCDVLIRCAGSRDPELQDAQVGVAATLAHLARNTAMQFTLIGKGLAGALCKIISNSPSACMPHVAKVVLAVAKQGAQGVVLVRAGVVKQLVAFLRRRLPCAHLRSTQAALHALLVHSRADASAAALEAGAVPHLLFSLSSSDQKARQRATRMLTLLLEAAPSEATAILARLECAAPLMRLLRHGDFVERAEAMDLIFLLRGSTQVLRGLASDGGVYLKALSEVLACCTPYQPHADLKPSPTPDPHLPPPSTAAAPSAGAAAGAVSTPASAGTGPAVPPPATSGSSPVAAGALGAGADLAGGAAPAARAAAAAAAAAAAEAAAVLQNTAAGAAALRRAAGDTNKRALSPLDAAEARRQRRHSVGVPGAISKGERTGRLRISSLTLSGLPAAASEQPVDGGWWWKWDVEEEEEALTAAEAGLFASSAATGARIDTEATAGKVVRVLCAMALHPEAQTAVSACGDLADPLCRLLPHHRGLHHWSSMAMASLPAPLAPPSRNSSRSWPGDGADDEEEGGSVRGARDRAGEAAEEGRDAAAPAAAVDVSDEVLERMRSILEIRADSPPSRGINVDLSEAPRLLSVPTSSTYQAAELLLSWLLESRKVPVKDLLEPLGLQAWLGNNVDVLHTMRFHCGPLDTFAGPPSPRQHAAEG